MQLRSGNTVPSGSTVPSRASTHSSRCIAPKRDLEPILEGHTSTSKSEDCDTISMSSSQGHRRVGERGFMDLLGNRTCILLYKYTNHHGGQVYTNDRNEYAVRVSDHSRQTHSHQTMVQVTDHGDHYMDAKGFKYLKTSRSNDLNRWENLALGSRIASGNF